MIGQAPAMDGKSILPLLLGKAATVRTYTLQEGYQSCEAGHGEVRAQTASTLLVDFMMSDLSCTHRLHEFKLTIHSRRPSLELTCIAGLPSLYH